MLFSDHCPHCNTRVPRAANRCPVCGAPVSARRPDHGVDPVVTRVTPLPGRKVLPASGSDDSNPPPPAAA
jgi:hypothetical protein